MTCTACHSECVSCLTAHQHNVGYPVSNAINAKILLITMNTTDNYNNNVKVMRVKKPSV